MGDPSHKDKAKKSTKNIDGVIKHHKHEKAAFASRHTPIRSKALMRKSVKKPEPSIKRKIKAYGAADVHLFTAKEVALQAELVKHTPLVPKSRIKKSPLISHFSNGVPKNTVRLEKSHYSPEELKFPAIDHSIKALPMHKSTTTADILERAMQKAVSHEQPPHPLPKSKRRKLASTWLASALVLLVLVVGVSQNMTSFKLQMASAKAGFTATLPSNMPSGYSMSGLKYGSGFVAADFRSNSSSESYAIIQRTSPWDSQTLKVSFVQPSDPHFITISSGGLTVFIYGNHNATWVSNGIWYKIQSNGALSDHELVSMASST